MDIGILDYEGVGCKGQEQFVEFFFFRLRIQKADWICGSLYKIMDKRYVKC